MDANTTQVLDPCCGSRMMWFDKSDQRAIFGDQRSETIVVTDRTHREDGTRTLTIGNDALARIHETRPGVTAASCFLLKSKRAEDNENSSTLGGN